MAAAQEAWAADLLPGRFHQLRPDQWFGRDVFLGHKSTRPEKRTIAAGNAW